MLQNDGKRKNGTTCVGKRLTCNHTKNNGYKRKDHNGYTSGYTSGILQDILLRIISRIEPRILLVVFSDFKRPLLKPQPTDLHEQMWEMISDLRPRFSNHQNAILGTSSKTPGKKTALGDRKISDSGNQVHVKNIVCPSMGQGRTRPCA